jgi:hypothetical protein
MFRGIDIHGMNVIDSIILERDKQMRSRHPRKRDCVGRLVPTFRHLSLSRARVAGLVASAILSGAGAAGAENAPPRPIPIAIIDFDYSDTSGEVLDQNEKHRMLLETFVASLRRDLARDGKYRIVALPCAQNPCSAGRSNPAQLLARARDAGAALLLYGGIHKTSTLVQWAKVQIVDMRIDKLVFDRLLTFRGDDERAWHRAEAFVVADIEKLDLLVRDRDEDSAAFQRKEQP